mmetsp:Transcript_44606/g.53996  ORF Transcript_44606/g.53996 Transcript_44606/m.53996 type:complete len:155 (-) Transcript_44606:259-723(-)
MMPIFHSSINFKTCIKIIALAAYTSTIVSSFSVLPAAASLNQFTGATTTASKTTRLNFFGKALQDAMKNDDSLGKVENPGIKGGPKFTEVTINGKSVKAVPGQRVSQVAAAARTKITYSCKKGDCGTCEITMNGRIVKACQAKIENGKNTINTM